MSGSRLWIVCRFTLCHKQSVSKAHYLICLYNMDQTTTFVLILFVVALLGLGFCIYWILRLKHRFEAAFATLDSKQNLSDTVTEYFTKLEATAKKLDNLRKSYGHLSDIGALSIQKTAVVRFNPFRNTGGDQSFVMALLDNNGS